MVAVISEMSRYFKQSSSYSYQKIIFGRKYVKKTYNFPSSSRSLSCAQLKKVYDNAKATCSCKSIK